MLIDRLFAGKEGGKQNLWYNYDGEQSRWKQQALGYGNKWISRLRSSPLMVEGVVSN